MTIYFAVMGGISFGILIATIVGIVTDLNAGLSGPDSYTLVLCAVSAFAGIYGVYAAYRHDKKNKECAAAHAADRIT